MDCLREPNVKQIWRAPNVKKWDGQQEGAWVLLSMFRGVIPTTSKGAKYIEVLILKQTYISPSSNMHNSSRNTNVTNVLTQIARLIESISDDAESNTDDRPSTSTATSRRRSVSTNQECQVRYLKHVFIYKQRIICFVS